MTIFQVVKTHLTSPELMQEFSIARVTLPVPGITILYTWDSLTYCNITTKEMTRGPSEHKQWSILRIDWEVDRCRSNVLLTKMSINLAGTYVFL